MRLVRHFLILTLLLMQKIPAGAQYRRDFPLPTPSVPGSLGVNIHFTDPRKGEMQQLAAAKSRNTTSARCINDYRTKPAYEAMKTLTQALDGFRFEKRLALDSPSDYCLLFEEIRGEG